MVGLISRTSSWLATLHGSRAAVPAIAAAGVLLVWPASGTIGSTAGVEQQGTPPGVQLVAPTSESMLVGPVEFEAQLSPAGTPARVEFFVDGVLACVVTAVPLRCRWDAGAEVKARTVRVVATLEAGERYAAAVRTSSLEHRVESVVVRSVLVPSVVTDNDGRFVQGLGRGDFRLLEDDRPVAITHFEAEDAPLAVVLTLDLSASMQRALPEVRDAVHRFVSALKPSDHVTVLGFTDRMYVLADGARDAVLQGRTLDRLSAGGTTALYDAVVYAIGRGRGGVGRHAVIVVSDGADMASQAELDSVERFVQSSDATLYTITVGQGARNRRVRTIMERLAERTGGRTFSGDGVADVVRALGVVRDDLAHQYLLAYSPETDAPAGYRRIRVVAGEGRYRVRTRQGHQPSQTAGPSPTAR